MQPARHREGIWGMIVNQAHISLNDLPHSDIFSNQVVHDAN